MDLERRQCGTVGRAWGFRVGLFGNTALSLLHNPYALYWSRGRNVADIFLSNLNLLWGLELTFRMYWIYPPYAKDQ